MYNYTYLYIYTYIHVCVHTYVYVHICTYVYIYIFRCMCIYTYIIYKYIGILYPMALDASGTWIHRAKTCRPLSKDNLVIIGNLDIVGL